MRNELKEIIDKCDQYENIRGILTDAELGAVLEFIRVRAIDVDQRCEELAQQDFFGTEGQLDPRSGDLR